MKLAVILAASIGLAVPAAKADDTHIGVGVGPVGVGVTIGESHDRDRTMVINEREVEPRERTTIIK